MHIYDKTDGAVDYQHICISDTLMKHSREGTEVSAKKTEEHEDAGECKKQRKTRMQGRMVKKIGAFKGLKLEWPPENKFYIHTMKIWEGG